MLMLLLLLLLVQMLLLLMLLLIRIAEVAAARSGSGRLDAGAWGRRVVMMVECMVVTGNHGWLTRCRRNF